MTSTATRARIRSFGTNDGRDAFAAKYGSADYATVGAAIGTEQRKHNTRQEAPVQDKPNAGTVETLYALAASRTPWIRDEAIAKYLETATAKNVAERIDWLEAQPVATLGSNTEFKAPATPARKVDVPEGRYAVRNAEGVVKFYKVDRPTEGRWAGYTFVKVQASDDLYPVKGKGPREAVLAAIAEAGVEASMTLYGRELGKCGHCGRTLTDEDSRARGIGPICYGKMGF